MPDQVEDEFLGWSRSEFAIETQNEQMCHTEIANERDLMLGGRQQMRRFLRPQYLRRMWIKGYYDSCAACLPRVSRRSGNDRLMAEVDSVENADRREKWTR